MWKQLSQSCPGSPGTGTHGGSSTNMAAARLAAADVFPAQIHISILKMILDLLHAGKRMSSRRPGSRHGSPRSLDACRRSWPQEAHWDALLGEHAGSNQTICPSSATALRKPELPGAIQPTATLCHHRGPYLRRDAMTDRLILRSLGPRLTAPAPLTEHPNRAHAVERSALSSRQMRATQPISSVRTGSESGRLAPSPRSRSPSGVQCDTRSTAVVLATVR